MTADKTNEKPGKLASTLAGIAVVGLIYLGVTIGWIWALILGVILLVVIGLIQQGNGENTPDAVDDVPSDKEFKRRGWIVKNWFNHDVLVGVISDEQDWTVARNTLQKVSYEITRDHYPDGQKDWFRRFMTEFARRDPIYLQTIERVRSAIRENPGLMQSDIYKDRSGKEKETVRYLLYFAHELGDIRREKSGRSYRLYLPKGSISGFEEITKH